MIVDGGNSYYVDDIRRSEALAEAGIHYLDCGTSGGVAGLERGYCLMIGGPAEAGGGASIRSSGPWRPVSMPRRGRRAGRATRHRPRTAICTAARAAPGTS